MRTYKRKTTEKRYKTYDEILLKQAVAELSSKSLQAVSSKYDIPKSVLYRRKTRLVKCQGGQTAIPKEVEDYIVKYLNVSGEWGYPLDALELRYIIKMYLDTEGIVSKRFKNNFPGPDFVEGFIKRHSCDISLKILLNIKPSQPNVEPDVIQEHFATLERSLIGVPPENIINYDETNITDDLNRKKVIMKRSCKYPERSEKNLNREMASVSIMMAGSAAGNMLPPYVVYKATHLSDTWVNNGPEGTTYNRTDSGWFNGEVFADWVQKVAIPYFKNKEGKKILIGDYLSSHLSIHLIKLCKNEDIHFVFVPSKAKYLTQPLDVAFYHNMKSFWQRIILEWKKADSQSSNLIPKHCIPPLLKLLIDELKRNAEINILIGFQNTGINPFNPNEVMSRMPQAVSIEEAREEVDEAVMEFMKDMEFRSTMTVEPENDKNLDEFAELALTAGQTNVLCTFFEENPEVVRGYKKTLKCIDEVQNKWKKIAVELNSLGPPRDYKSWAKYLCDVKAKLKKKRIKWTQSSDGTGPVMCNADEFNEVGLRMLQVLRKDSSSQDLQECHTSDFETEEEISYDHYEKNDDFNEDLNKDIMASLTDNAPDDQENRKPVLLSIQETQPSQFAFDDEFDFFGKNVAYQLRTLPLAVALETQEMLLSILRKQRLGAMSTSRSDPLGNPETIT